MDIPNCVPVMNGFVKDENGKFHIVPMKFPGHTSMPNSDQKSSGNRTTIRRQFIPIQPLLLTSADFEIEQASKKRKIETQVRKELFKIPDKKRDTKFQAKSRRSSSILKAKTIIRREIKKKNINDGSPLLDIDEAEEYLNQENPILKPINTVLFPKPEIQINGTTPVKTSPKKNDTTPSNNESMQAELEFLAFEQNLASVKKNNKHESSPLTSVCDLLKNTKITNGKKDPRDDILDKVSTILNEDVEHFQQMKQHFKKYEEDHDRRITVIKELVEQCVENKENASRRSARRSSKSGNKFLVSPAIAKKVDLRKRTLNKNLSKNVQCDSPRTQNAVDMYNNFRNDCTVLCTPKLNRTTIELPQQSVTRSLSRRIQKQCLMLQDTPKLS